MNTKFPSAKDLNPAWHVVDADGQPLGRLATKVATLLMGKHKPSYTPFLDTGDFVVVVNAAKVKLTGNKEEQKMYRRHSGYPGALKETTFKVMREKHPDRIIQFAVSGMLPKTTLGKHMLKKLKVYAGDQHPHQAQQPAAMEV